MEKFNTWADAYTGVQPFLPLPPNLGELGFPLVLLYWLKWLILGPIVPVPSLRRMFLRGVHFAIGRLLLFLLGFYNVDESYMPSKRGNRTPTSGSAGDSATHGHVIIANHNSYVDLIYLLYKYSPVFTTLPNTWEGEAPPQGVAVPRSFFGAISDAIHNTKYTKEQGVALDSLVEKAKKGSLGPVVIFPEATTTNGKVLLGVVPAVTANVIGDTPFHVLAFKYDHTEFSPVYTCGSFIWHFLRLASQVSNDLQVRFVIDADIPQVTAETNKEEWIDNLYTLLSTAMQKRRAKITVKEKFPFLQYYRYNRYKK